MNVKALVELNYKYLDVPHSISANIGDGFLCQNNKFYRKIRKMGINFGTEYALKHNDLWNDYIVFPFVNFDDILNKKTIPVIDNFNTLVRLSEKHPTLNLPEKFIRDSFKRNYLLHETCHCIANEFLAENSQYFEFSREEFSVKQITLLNSLLGEALANSVEIISSSIADNDAHIFFHALNSYVPYSPKANEILKDAVKAVGIVVFLKLTFISFFFNNILGYEHTEINVENLFNKFEPYFEFEGNTESKQKLLEAILKCCRLNTRFRDETSKVYFGSFGLGKEYEELTTEKVLDNLQMVEYLVWSTNRLCDPVLEDIES